MFFLDVGYVNEKYMKQFILFSLFAGGLMLMAFVWNFDDSKAETSIQFTDARWDDLLAKAKTENKIIFVDIYATWCGPCKLLKKTTFTDKEVGEYFNANFINATFDGEKEEGRKLVEQYGLHSYPTMLFINPDGSIRKAAIGYHSANQLLKTAKTVVN